METGPSQRSRCIAGIDRTHAKSFAQKSLFVFIVIVTLVTCTYITFGYPSRIVDPVRAKLDLAATVLYAGRLGVTLFYLMRRKFSWAESLGLGFTILILGVGLCLLAAGFTRNVPIPIHWPDLVALALVLFGSYLNTYSEIQRKRWKARPENRDKCYTKKLFALSRHINYFGDCVLFAGWCLLTATPWTLVIPILMALMFVFYHIPALEHYLEKRYGPQFSEYKKQTKAFIPFLY